MAKAIRATQDKSQGHCYSPTVPLVGSFNVLVNGFPVVRQGDNYGQSHSCGNSNHNMGIALEGSPTVFANGLPIHRDADKIQCGDVADNGSPNVFIDGITNNTIGYTVNPPIITYPYTQIYMVKDCPYFYTTQFQLIGPILIPDIYTPIVEEDTGTVFKDYTIPVSALTINPKNPFGFIFNNQTGILTANGIFGFVQGAITYNFTCKNFVGVSFPAFSVTIHPFQSGPLGWICG